MENKPTLSSGNPGTVREQVDFFAEGVENDVTARNIHQIADFGKKEIQRVLLVDVPVASEVDAPEEEVLNYYWKAQNMIGPPGYREHMDATKYSRGLLTIGKALQEQGIPTEYISANDINDITDFDARVEDADLIGIANSFTAFHPIVRAMSSRVRHINNEAIVILGGTHASHADRETLLRTPGADIIVRGEGERTMVDLAQGEATITSIPGISYRTNDGIQRTIDRTPLSADQIPLPLYDLLPRDPNDYSYKLQTARGCPFKCAFCVDGFPRKKVASTAISHPIKELLHLKDTLCPGTHLHFIDSIFTMNKSRVMSLLDEIRRQGLGDHFRFSCDVRAGHADKAMVKAMSDAGFTKILIGLEDPNDEVLAASQKGVHIQEDLETASLFKRNSDISVTGYWMIGLPGSTHDTMHKTIAAAREFLRQGIIDEIDCAMFVPVPGTPMYEQPEQYGIELLEPEWSERYLRCQFDRAVYRNTNGLSEHQIANYFQLFVSTVLQEYLKKLDMTLSELVNSK